MISNKGHDKALVAWSGGLDSSLILHDLLVEARLLGDVDGSQTIRTFEVESDMLAGAMVEQKAARERIVVELTSRGFRPKRLVAQVAIPDYRCSVTSPFGTQPQFWVGLATPHLYADENLVLGWHRGDDAFHYSAAVGRAFSGLRDAVGGEARRGELLVPLEWMTKAAIIEAAQAAGLYDLAWWCEEPVKMPGIDLLRAGDPLKATFGARGQIAIERAGRDPTIPCEKCVPCETHATALWEIEQRHQRRHVGGDQRYGDPLSDPLRR